jgi:hypothetical protein
VLQNKLLQLCQTTAGLYINIFLTCPFGQLHVTKKSTCPTKSFSCPKKLIKITKTRELLSAICVKCFSYCLTNNRIMSLLILTKIMIMTSLINKLTYI